MPNIAIDNLNKVIDKRNAMISAILHSKQFKTNKQYDNYERQLEHKSYAQLDKLHKKLK